MLTPQKIHNGKNINLNLSKEQVKYIAIVKYNKVNYRKGIEN